MIGQKERKKERKKDKQNPMGLLKQEAAGFEPGRATSIHYLLGINAPNVSTLRPNSKEGVMAAKKGWGTIFFSTHQKVDQEN